MDHKRRGNASTCHGTDKDRDNLKISKTDPTMEYEMNHKRRGLALIFNHEHFKFIPKRRGTKIDRDNLKQRFQALGFEVNIHDNKNKTEVFEEILKASEMDHTDADCFVCVFLTHGKEGQISASDDMINIKEITDPFRGDQCKSLVGKPKIFIFQACAGEKYEDAVTGMVGGSSDDTEEDLPYTYTIPAGADFLMCYSVAEGFYSFRDTTSGTFYIQDLCETLKQHGSTLEFTELLTLVNLKVSRRDANLGFGKMPKKQMPCFTSMLTKKLYFRCNK
ncbi:caspase-6-like isoform X2 [Tachysurus fulvidraco]|uniref:caspase-6-like isoform X2 n=1 Tax=Tachysurus fulvidraco TaxID=1234273 RepID=UPI000F4D71CA|nr:caspase-6-like isoform X2 [Tachysurus fulvidraco]XP_027001705.1 caspase-6-like isoform X2 [Tachysurus fulvidraco]XP_027001706.1 caspase-6-like isoform X2 [Tachysurus fulvidraco]XP_027001707.1 caspase-6-like isoform X2 [Tachysurus fulvidraco]